MVFRTGILFCLLWLVPLGARAETHTWTVRAGDALSVLAERFGCSVDELRSWNSLESDRIFVGQELVVRRERNQGGEEGQTYAIAEGDTLSEVAVRFGVSLEDLLQWNEGLDPDRIQAGQEIRIGPARHRIEYTIRAGDSLSRIARRHEVSVSQLRGWNPRLRRDHLREGRTLVIYSEIPESTTVSVGYPYSGRLERGIRMNPHPGIELRDRNRAWGTLETVTWLRGALDEVHNQHRGRTRIRLHDISHRQGGYMAGHRSHQSGRDVDLAYYQRRCGGEACSFRRVNPRDLDAERQWTLFKYWLERDQVDAIFIDYNLQRPLYEQAREEGASREELHRWFQYPRGRSYPLGIVRHYDQHRDHIHVRFRCHETDDECR
ncbi:MAG: penicillin-insensitive murein endopeptidase [Myxococcota bacterium]